MKQQVASLMPDHHFGIEDLRGLIGPHGHPCLSLYLPTPSGGTGDAPDRFAGLLRQARHLLAGSIGDTEVREFLGPLEGLGPEFWQEQQRGLALFHSRDHDACWSLEMPVPELAVVSE